MVYQAVKNICEFLFSRDNTVTPFKISSFVVIINVIISILFFKQIGFIVIPIATTLSTWIGVFIISVYFFKNWLFKN